MNAPVEVNWNHDNPHEVKVDHNEEIDHWQEKVVDWNQNVHVDPQSDGKDKLDDPCINLEDPVQDEIDTKNNESNQVKDQPHDPGW